MFNGTLGVYLHKRVHIDIDPNAKPVHSRPCSVPQIHLKTFKKELDHLIKIGILAAQQESEWASPLFIIPKKDGRVCWISKLCQLNKFIRRKQYPLPIIMDILCKHSGYKFSTKLDVSMQYYTFELDEESQDLCTIVTPFVKYKYLRLLMDSNALQILLKQQWKIYCQALKMLTSTSMMLVLSPILGPPCQLDSHYFMEIT